MSTVLFFDGDDKPRKRLRKTTATPKVSVDYNGGPLDGKTDKIRCRYGHYLVSNVRSHWYASDEPYLGEDRVTIEFCGDKPETKLTFNRAQKNRP